MLRFTPRFEKITHVFESVLSDSILPNSVKFVCFFKCVHSNLCWGGEIFPDKIIYIKKFVFLSFLQYVYIFPFQETKNQNWFNIIISWVESTHHKHDLDGKPLYPLHEVWQESNYKHAYIYTWNIAIKNT